MAYYPEKKPEDAGAEQKQTGKTEKQKRLLRLCAAAVCCALAVYGAVRLIRYYAELQASRNTAAELQQINETQPPESTAPEQTAAVTVSPAPEPAGTAEIREQAAPAAVQDGNVLRPVTYPDNPNLQVPDRFQRLRRKSGYIIGWLKCDLVDEAVALKDDTFFLNHDATGKRNSNGAIFLDSSVNLLTRPYTLILYGHNMKTGNMFGRLKKYKENEYFYQHRIITFDTLYEEGQYAVFSVMEMNTMPGTALWYDLWSLMTDSRKDRAEAIRILQGRSAIPNTLDVQADEQLLLLVTCLDGDTERLVVAARRLREGESAGSLALR